MNPLMGDYGFVVNEQVDAQPSRLLGGSKRQEEVFAIGGIGF